MSSRLVGVAAIVVLAAVASACSNAADASNRSQSSVTDATDAGASCTDPTGTNLLDNPSFEEGTTLATGWTDESSTAGDPTFSLSTTTGVVDGGKAQRMRYTGRDGDDGTKKTEFYQGPVQGIAPGQTVRFSLCVSGAEADAMTKAYAIIGIEAFKADRTYISDVSTNITEVSAVPIRYTRDYTIPEGTSYLAVFVQSPEFTAASAIDLYFDDASLVIV